MSDTNQQADVIVIGAGAMGSATAYHLARQGLRVTLLEQFELDHRWGSSYGMSRIIRYSYHLPQYIALAGPNYELWHDLEEAYGQPMLRTTGGIDFGKGDATSLIETRESLEATNTPHEVLDADEGNRRFPQFRFSDDMQILYQPDSGFLPPSLAVRAHVELAQRHGAVFRDREPIQSIQPLPDGVTVKTADGVYHADRVVVTAGAWAQSLLQQTGLNLPLQPLRCQLSFFEPPADGSHDAAAMPVFIYHREDHITKAMYGIPSDHGSGVKVAFNGGEPHAHPSVIDYNPDEATVQRVRDAIGDHLPVAKHGKRINWRICLYTQTPDADFVIDHHPATERVVIGAGFSGHGFKFSALIGKILADLATHGTTPHDISLFAVKRFMERV